MKERSPIWAVEKIKMNVMCDLELISGFSEFKGYYSSFLVSTIFFSFLPLPKEYTHTFLSLESGDGLSLASLSPL